MNRTKNTFNNIAWGIVNTITGILLPFMTHTVIIYYLGVDYVGLGSLFNSILQVLSFTELGIGTALVYSMYEPIAKNDEMTVCALLNFYKKSYRIIGIIVFVVGIIILPLLNQFIKGTTPNDTNVYILYIIYLLNNVVSYFFFAEKSSLLLACQRDDINSKIHIMIKFVLNLTQITAVIFFRNYYVFTICIPVFTFVQQISSGYIAQKVYPQYFCIGEISKEKLNEVKKNVGGMVFQKIGNIILTSVDTIVISSFLGLRILGIYNSYYYIFTSLNGFLGVILRSLVPSVGNSLVSTSAEKNYNDFEKFHMIYEWIVVWWTACILCLSQSFMELWVGKKLMLSDSIVVLLAIYFFFFKWLDITYVYRESSGVWWEGKWLPIIASIVNLILNIILVQVIGLAGILLSTIISLLLIHDTMGVYILKKYCFNNVMSIKKFYFKQVLVLLSAVFVCTITYFICHYININTVKFFIAKIVICAIVPNLLLALIWCKWGVIGNIYNIVRKSIEGSIAND